MSELNLGQREAEIKQSILGDSGAESTGLLEVDLFGDSGEDMFEPAPHSEPASKPTPTSTEEVIEKTDNKEALESIEADLDGTTTEITEDEKVDEEAMKFSFGDEVEEAEEVKAVEEGAELSDLEKALNRISELEKRQNDSMSEKEFESTYSKEKVVMPGISEYDYAKMGKEVSDKGNLSEDTYKALLEKGYSKDVVDNHIKTAFESVKDTQEVQEVKDVPQEVVRSNFAKELNMDVNGLNSLLEDVKGVFSAAQISKFDSMTPQEQVNTLLKFQNQKLTHDKKVKGKTLAKGNSTSQKSKSAYDSVSVGDLQKELTKAIHRGDYSSVNRINSALISKGEINTL